MISLDLMKSSEVRKAGDHVIIPALLVIANILRKINQVGILGCNRRFYKVVTMYNFSDHF